ncbi:MAG: T9SS type A sorting domain-containing protein [Flavobacteriaceae bacterium]|nr:T9SS type A sorting domain-containing protein [Flavobacteriaceae bacterium]
MKKITTSLLSMFMTFIVMGQNAPIDFEAGGEGAGWTWTVFENDDNPPLEIVPNPVPTGINTSATVAKFTAREMGAPFAGVESMHGSDIGFFTLDASNAEVRIKVYKTKISDVGIKFVQPSSASLGEMKVANTLINQWEELVFDFTPYIGDPISTDLDQIVIFPDFIDRTNDEFIYFDDITFGEVLSVPTNNSIETVIYPNPMNNGINLQASENILHVEIIGLMGQQVFKVEVGKSASFIDITDLTAGLYFLKMNFSNNRTKTIKILKK